MKSTVKYLLLFFVSLCIPSSSLFAQGATDAVTGIATVGSLITIFTSSVVKATGTLFMSLAVVAFIYGIVEYIWGMRDAKPDKISNGQKFMVWSLVALFVMFSVYGIVKFGQDILFQGRDMTKITIPEINLQGSNSSNNQAYNGGQVSQVSSPSRQVLGGQGYMPSLGGTSYSAPPSGGQVSSAQGSSGVTTVGTGRARASLTLNYASNPSARTSSSQVSNSTQTTIPYGNKCDPKSALATCITGTSCTQVPNGSFVCLRPDEVVVSSDF